MSRTRRTAQAAPAPKIWRAARYARLSREDGDKPESDSITGQAGLMDDYLLQHPELTPGPLYTDDGYTGTNFDRPEFRQMVQDIEAGKIDCVLVKDLSRFGRKYIEMGRYLERWFPEHGARFIAINDGTDSEQGPYDSFMNTATFFFSTNRAVLPPTTNDAFLSRLVLIPFLRSIPAELQDRFLGGRLAAQRDGIIMKAFRYCRELRNWNYQFSGNSSINIVVNRQNDLAYLLVFFLRNECLNDPSGRTPTQVLYEKFFSRFEVRFEIKTFSLHLSKVPSTMFPKVKKERRRIDRTGLQPAGFVGWFSSPSVKVPGDQLYTISRKMGGEGLAPGANAYGRKKRKGGGHHQQEGTAQFPFLRPQQ